MPNERFADSFYWIALVDRGDQWHTRVKAEAAHLADARIVTTEEVLVEFLAAMRQGQARRRLAAQAVEMLLADASVEVIPQSHETFLVGLDLYRSRADKSYSLTDCVSMQVMRTRGIHEVLTADEHFEQEGFVCLFRRPPRG